MNSDVLGEERCQIAQEERQDNTGATEWDRNPVRPLVSICHCPLSGIGDLVAELFESDTRVVRLNVGGLNGDGRQVVEDVVLRLSDGLSQSGNVREISACKTFNIAQLVDDSLDSDIVLDVLEDVAVEDVVVDAEANSAANETNGQTDSCDGTQKLVRANDLSDNGNGDNDTADTNACQAHRSVGHVDVIRVGNGNSASTSSHHCREEQHDSSNIALGERDSNERDDSASENAEADGQRTDTDANVIVTVDVVDLSGPEEQHVEEVGTRDTGDEKGGNHGALSAAEDCWGDHWVLCAINLPEEVGNDQDTSDQERDEDVNGLP